MICWAMVNASHSTKFCSKSPQSSAPSYVLSSQLMCLSSSTWPRVCNSPMLGIWGEVVSCWVYCPTSLIMLGKPSKAMINHPYFDGLYRPCMVNLNMVYYCFTNIKILSIIAPHGKHRWFQPLNETKGWWTWQQKHLFHDKCPLGTPRCAKRTLNCRSGRHVA